MNTLNLKTPSKMFSESSREKSAAYHLRLKRKQNNRTRMRTRNLKSEPEQLFLADGTYGTEVVSESQAKSKS